MRIAIVDDIASERTLLRDRLEQQLGRRGVHADLTEFENGEIFGGTKYKVVYELNMEDYLLCHAAFVMPAAFACYKTGGDLKKLRRNTVYLGRVIDANIEGYTQPKTL